MKSATPLYKGFMLLIVIIAFAVLNSCAEKLAGSSDMNGGGGQTTGEMQLIYFWMFDGNLPNNTELQTIDATFPSNPSALISFESALSGYPNTARRASMERRNSPTSINYRSSANGNIPYEESDMRGIQVKQPFTGDNGENTMIFHIPMQNLANPVLAFAAKDEGTGTEALLIDYAINEGTPQWITTDLAPSERRLDLKSEYALLQVRFAGIDEVADNPNFRVRLRFDVANGDAETGDRVTFNNVSVEAEPLM